MLFLALSTPLLAATPVAAYTYYDSTPGSCRIFGDPDVYGIGIRLSYYLQWFAVLLGLFIAPAAANVTRAATNTITVAVFINTLHGAQTEGTLMAVEWYIVQYLVFWLLLANIPTNKAALKTSAGSLVVVLLNYVTVICVNLWLYWGSDELGHKDGCEPYIFLFTPIAAYNAKWILANKVLSMAGILAVWLPFLGAVWFIWAALVKWNKKDKDASEETRAPPTTEAERHQIRLFGGQELELDEEDYRTFVKAKRVASKLVRMYLTFLVIGNGAIAIAFVEMTIHINNISFQNSSLEDSGQLIPLLIGIFTVLSVLWEGLQQMLRKRGKRK